MLDSNKIDFRTISTVLEPSSGRGDLAKVIQEKLESARNKQSIDCIEIDPHLVAILKQNFRVIHDDFLTFNTYKHYDIICMNPPFHKDEGCKHLLKAIDIQQNGGSIVCLLNAESIRNPYSVYRQDLKDKLEKYNAEIEFIEDGFNNSDSLRKTGVEIALIRINIEKTNQNSVIIDHLKQQEQYTQQNKKASEVVTGNFIDRVITQYNFEIKAGVKLIQEYENIKPYISCNFNSDSPILSLMISGDKYEQTSNSLTNEYIRKIRYKYWETLLQSKELRQLLTTDLYTQYMAKLDELKEYDFSEFNINQIKLDMQLLINESVEKTVYKLFEEFTFKYSYNREFDNNIHLYNGWISNSCSKLNDRKTIIPLNAYDSWNKDTPYFTKHHFIGKLQDIEKVFNYLDGGRTDSHEDLYVVLKKAQDDGQTKNINTKYAILDTFKKGTCHLKWKDKDLVQKFNIFAAKYQNNLPPNYGKQNYSDMSDKERAVVDSFQGKESYENVFKNKGFYLSGSQLLQLESKGA